jgi:hypothetical protein
MGPLETATREAKRQRDLKFFPPSAPVDVATPNAPAVVPPQPRPPLTSGRLIQLVTMHFKVAILDGPKTHETMHARYAAIYLFRTLTRLTFRQMAEAMRCDETSIRYGLGKAKARISTDLAFARHITELDAAASEKFTIRRRSVG